MASNRAALVKLLPTSTPNSDAGPVTARFYDRANGPPPARAGAPAPGCRHLCPGLGGRGPGVGRQAFGGLVPHPPVFLAPAPRRRPRPHGLPFSGRRVVAAHGGHPG